MARKYTSMDINCFSLSTGKIFGRLITDLGTDSQGVTWESKLRQNMDTEVLDFAEILAVSKTAPCGAVPGNRMVIPKDQGFVFEKDGPAGGKIQFILISPKYVKAYIVVSGS